MVAGFMNTSGGSLVIGVHDTRTQGTSSSFASSSTRRLAPGTPPGSRLIPEVRSPRRASYARRGRLGPCTRATVQRRTSSSGTGRRRPIRIPLHLDVAQDGVFANSHVSTSTHMAVTRARHSGILRRYTRRTHRPAQHVDLLGWIPMQRMPRHVPRHVRRALRPLRNKDLPILTSNGRGLRVRLGWAPMSAIVHGVRPPVESALLALVRKGDHFYDIGAEIGWFAMLCGRRTNSLVVAFEPVLENAALVVHNARTNRLPITVVPAAVTDFNGWARFARRERRLATYAPDTETAVPVPAVTLDSWITATGHPMPDVVKIDVEAPGLDVLRGMESVIERARPALLIKMHGEQDALANWLDAHEYEHGPIDFGTSTRSAPWWAHVLATPGGWRSS
jgi:FkbM family methyltransferase